MQRVRITRPRRTRDHRREAECFQILPLDPRDPAIVRAKELGDRPVHTAKGDALLSTRYRGLALRVPTIEMTISATERGEMYMSPSRIDHVEGSGRGVK
jgi:hypothetical protein